MEPMTPIELAAKAVGGPSRLAEIIGVSIQTLGHWRGRGVPIERCIAVEQATGGKVTRRDLRPDDWHKVWPDLEESA